jgi:hypothetical protein
MIASEQGSSDCNAKGNGLVSAGAAELIAAY